MGVAKNAFFRAGARIARQVATLIPESMVARTADEALRVRHRLLERARRRRARTLEPTLPPFRAFDGEALRVSVVERREPWRRMQPSSIAIPGMLTFAERQYYEYISRFYCGYGEVLELGTWLGLSTAHILAGLSQNPLCERKLHCFDDFVWRSSWMNKWLPASASPPVDYSSFQPQFEVGLARYRDRIAVHRARFSKYDGNEGVPEFEWRGGPIELCFVDCGRLLAVNEAWYAVVRPSLIPNRSLLVLQDWQNHKSVPEVWWENMKIFTDSKGEELELLHEIRDGAIGTFMFRGSEADCPSADPRL